MTRTALRVPLRQRLLLLTILAACLGAGAGAVREVPRRATPRWTVAYWLWAGQPAQTAAFRPDMLFIDVPARRWPVGVPAADQYVIVRRIEASQPLTAEVASALSDDYDAIRASAGDRPVAGLQIDYDCPTTRLRAYAGFLATLRAHLPPATSLSITALLDWFGPGTRVRDVVSQVDEFIPQFYDTAPARQSAGIAATIDVPRWAPVFNAFGVPYRIGVASFGRAARVRTETGGARDVRYFRDVSPLDLAHLPGTLPSTRSTTTAEDVIRYDVMAPIGGKAELAVGDAVEFTMPTIASVRAAVAAARRFGGWCAGIGIFRWPNLGESLVMPADLVHRLISGQPLTPSPGLYMTDGHCLERQCADLSIDLEDSSGEQAIFLDAENPIDLFLPSGPVSVVLVTPTRLAIRLPAHPGFGRIALGRAMSDRAVHLRIVQP